MVLSHSRIRRTRLVQRLTVYDRGAVEEIAVGRTRASAASLGATRGTSTQTAPTAERSHCLPNEKQHDDGHDVAYDARYLWD